MLWTERHRSSLAQMNHYFVQALQTSKQLSTPGVDTEDDSGDDTVSTLNQYQYLTDEGGEEASTGKKERERAVVCEWVHSLCDAGELADAKRKLKDLWALLERPLKFAHTALAACEERADGEGAHSGDDLSHNRWSGIDRAVLDLLEEEMSYLLLKAKLEEASPWPLSTIVNSVVVDGSAVREPQRPPSSLAAAEGYERALSLAEKIAEHGPIVQCLKRPIPEGCFKYSQGRLRPSLRAPKPTPAHGSSYAVGNTAPVLANGDYLRDVLGTCQFPARIGPQARAFRELSRSQLSLYDPAAAMASVRQCLQLVCPPLELMAADTSHRALDELTGGKQPLVQLGPAVGTPQSALRTDRMRVLDLRVLGPGTTLSPSLSLSLTVTHEVALRAQAAAVAAQAGQHGDSAGAPSGASSQQQTK